MFQISSLLKSSVLAGAICFAVASAVDQSTGKPPDPQIGDIAYTAGQADIGTAILALKKTENKAVESYARGF
jgi:predicted outer membrane protein